MSILGGLVGILLGIGGAVGSAVLTTCLIRSQLCWPSGSRQSLVSSSASTRRSEPRVLMRL